LPHILVAIVRPADRSGSHARRYHREGFPAKFKLRRAPVRLNEIQQIATSKTARRSRSIQSGDGLSCGDIWLEHPKIRNAGLQRRMYREPPVLVRLERNKIRGIKTVVPKAGTLLVFKLRKD
jgi:hypothetical protein